MNNTILTPAILFLVLLSANTKIFSQNTEVLLKTAEVAIEKKDYDGALKNLNTVLAKQSNNADALTQKTRVLYFQKKLEEAIAQADKAIAANPKNSVAYNVRGLAKRDLGKDAAGALADFEKAVALDPKNPKALMNRGLMYLNLSRFDDALADMNRAIELAPSEVYYYTRGGFYNSRKEYDKAIADFTKAVELAPNADNIYGNRAEIYLAQSKNITDETFLKAKADAEKALSLNPQNGRALFVRGQIKYFTNDETGALTDILAARKLNPNLNGFDRVYNFNWSKSPDNLRLELFDARLTKLKSEFENELTDYDKQLKLEIAFRDIPQTARQNDPARYTFEGYLDALLKNDPNNPCLNRYRLIKTNVESAGKEVWRLPQYETDAAKLTDAVTAEKFKPCAAGIARDVASKRYEIANRKLSQNFAENFEKSAAWATKANQISKGAGDGVLNSLDKLAEEYGEISENKARIRRARSNDGSSALNSSVGDSQNKTNTKVYEENVLIAQYNSLINSTLPGLERQQQYIEKRVSEYTRVDNAGKIFMRSKIHNEITNVINSHESFITSLEKLREHAYGKSSAVVSQINAQIGSVNSSVEKLRRIRSGLVEAIR